MESFGTLQLATLKPEPLTAPIIESDAIGQVTASALVNLVTLQSAADVITAYAQKSPASVGGNASAAASSEVIFNLLCQYQLDIHHFYRPSMNRSTFTRSQAPATTPW